MTIFTHQTSSPSRPDISDSPATSARIVETVDAAGSAGTVYSMSSGDTFAGHLSTGNDRDWVAIELQAGEVHTFSLSGTSTGGGSLSDPYLRLYNSNGELIAYNDDSDGLDSALVGSVNTSGTYYLSAGSYADSYSGTYELSAISHGSPPPPPPPGPDPVLGTLDDLAAYLTDGYWEDNNFVRHSFDTTADNVISVNLTGLTAAGQQLARWAFDSWEMVADIQFQETGSGTADIRFQDHESGAYSSSYDIVGGNTGYSIVNVETSWINYYGTSIDSYSLQTYIHEIGHALGLGHQGDYNGSATYGTDNTYSNDSWQLSIMSYFSQSENSQTDASEALLLGPMMVDIIAIQDLYGAAGGSSETAGNTVWGANSGLGGALGDYFDNLTGPTGNYTGEDIAFTIYDQSGVDTVDLSPISTANRIDMRDGYFSDVGGLIGNIGIARGTVLENLIGGLGNDTVTGNAADNNIDLGGGINIAFGGAGNDTLSGAGREDLLYGQGDDDLLVGNGGTDRLYGEAGNDTLDGGNGNDTLSGGENDDVLNGGEGGDGLYGGTGNDALHGNDGNDSLYGGVGSDHAWGGAGNDFLRGDSGNDVMHGGEGTDTLSGGNDDDRLFGELGQDTLYGGGGNDALSGGDEADKLYGQGGNDNLYGGLGNDTLSGDIGTDRLYGEDGMDRLFGDQGNDTLSGGNDADKLYGQDGMDSLFGGQGNDTVSGGNDADKIYGGQGNDRLFGDDGNDTVVGEDGNDYLYGGNGNDRLFGNDGLDRLFGGNDNDLLHGGAHNDRLYGDSGSDRLIGGTGNDYLLGGSGSDRLEGGDGADILIGGTEADVFVFTDGTWADRVTDFSTVEADRISFTDVTTLNSFADVTAAATDTIDGLLIQTGNGGSILLETVLLSDLDAADFIF